MDLKGKHGSIQFMKAGAVRLVVALAHIQHKIKYRHVVHMATEKVLLKVGEQTPIQIIKRRGCGCSQPREASMNKKDNVTNSRTENLRAWSTEHQRNKRQHDMG